MHFNRIARWLAAATAAVILCTASPAHAVTNPQQGVFYNCQTQSACNNYIDWLHNVGIHLFVLPPATNFTEGAGIAAHVASLGDRVWWQVPGNAGASWTNAATWIDGSKNWAGTGGYYTWDEPALHGDSPWATAIWTQSVKDHAPGEDTFMGHWSGCTSAGQQNAQGPYNGQTNYAGAICYPVTNHDGNTADAGIVYGPDVKARSLALQTSPVTHAVAVPKAFSWTDPDVAGQGPSVDSFPSAPEVATMLNCARKAGVEKVIWWGIQTWDQYLFTNGPLWNQRWEDWTSGIQAAYSDPGTCV